ncbi:MAG: MFS transporter [Actinomycetota bacterium]|nr:MFS transporter [Actinomycetota bacterium]
MKNFDKTVFTYKENKYLSLIFFLFGISIMSLAPRTPDLKANLAVNNGTFGTLLSAASLGSIVMLLIGGQIIHTIGAKNGLRIGSSIIALSFVILVHTRSPLIFLIANICAGAGISIYHIASSGHTLHRQDEIGKIIIPKLHGSWAIGAMSTSAIAFFISDYVSIAWHLTTLMICTWLVTQYCVTKLSITFPPKPDADDAYQLTSIKQFKFKINWLLSIGFFCSSILEFTIADWATLFGKEELGMGASVATLSYLFFLVGLIIGRFSIGWALNHQSEQFWLKTGGVVGGLGFASALIISTSIVDLNKNLAFVIAFSGFFLAGLGSSAMAPMFFSIAGRLSDGRNALAVAQLSFINAFAIYVAKTTLAWVAQLTSITVALMFTGLIMSLLIYFGKVGSNQRV